MTEKNGPASEDTDRGQGTADRATDPTATPRAAQPHKWERVLRAFLDRGPQGWNRFESARELRDHVLPTTVDQLQKRGVRIMRRDEIVPGAFGPVHCARYWIAVESRARALELLAK